MINLAVYFYKSMDSDYIQKAVAPILKLLNHLDLVYFILILQKNQNEDRVAVV